MENTTIKLGGFIDDDSVDQAKEQLNQQVEIIKSMDAEKKNDPNNKLYLILFYIENQDNSDSEYTTTFEFVTGRQKTYDMIKDMLKDPEYGRFIDVSKSRVYADSPKIQISHKVSIYKFMYDMKYKNLVEDNDSSFDIDDWKDAVEVDNNETE